MYEVLILSESKNTHLICCHILKGLKRLMDMDGTYQENFD